MREEHPLNSIDLTYLVEEIFQSLFQFRRWRAVGINPYSRQIRRPSDPFLKIAFCHSRAVEDHTYALPHPLVGKYRHFAGIEIIFVLECQECHGLIDLLLTLVISRQLPPPVPSRYIWFTPVVRLDISRETVVRDRKAKSCYVRAARKEQCVFDWTH